MVRRKIYRDAKSNQCIRIKLKMDKINKIKSSEELKQSETKIDKIVKRFIYVSLLSTIFLFCLDIFMVIKYNISIGRFVYVSVGFIFCSSLIAICNDSTKGEQK